MSLKRAVKVGVSTVTWLTPGTGSGWRRLVTQVTRWPRLASEVTRVVL